MRMFLIIMALVFNLALIILECNIFMKVKNKLNILKFYTFLQNFIAVLVSVIFEISLMRTRERV